MHRSSIAGLLGALLLGPTAALAAPLPEAPTCAILPADNPWNQRVDGLPVASGSATMVAATGMTRLHADFSNVGGYGIPYNVVAGSQSRVPVSFAYADESDPGPYPIPPGARIEGGSDAHVLVVDRDACRLYETFASEPQPDGSWFAGSGAIFDLRSNALRPAGWTSADAAGLPILPGLARADEVVGRAVIDHALRFTLPASQRAYLYPARHYASSDRRPWQAPMGLRLRLKASYDVSSYGPQTRVLLTALKTYGMLMADNGSAGMITGAPSPLWDDDDLHALHGVPGTAFEVVDTSSLTGTPRHTALNVSPYLADGTQYLRFLHTAGGSVWMEAVRDGLVVARITPRFRRQGYVVLTMTAVPGATYRVGLG